jgi:fatty acid CoA ligase FadD28
VYGGNAALGYWRKPDETERTFGARLVAASRGIPEGPWLRTGELGFFSDGELFVMGRIKDRSIGRGHHPFPDDIDTTLSQITRGREAGHRRMGPTPKTMPCAG